MKTIAVIFLVVVGLVLAFADDELIRERRSWAGAGLAGPGLAGGWAGGHGGWAGNAGGWAGNAGGWAGGHGGWAGAGIHG